MSLSCVSPHKGRANSTCTFLIQVETNLTPPAKHIKGRPVESPSSQSFAKSMQLAGNMRCPALESQRHWFGTNRTSTCVYSLCFPFETQTGVFSKRHTHIRMSGRDPTPHLPSRCKFADLSLICLGAAGTSLRTTGFSAWSMAWPCVSW